MNKDIIYIEPENDITDILMKLKQAENKVVALVPPKKAGVLRSAVNVKLISKAAREAEKVVVLVTADPAIIKLAASTRIPVAKTLQSRPEIPTDEDVAASMQKEQVIEEDLSDDNDETNAPKTEKSAKDASAHQKSAEKSKNDKSETEKTEESNKSQEKKSDKKKSKIPNLDQYRKWIIIGASAFVLIIGFLIWALVFAPATTIDIIVKADANNFSENITFTTKDSEENIEDGKFLLEERKIEKKNTVDFQATGKKDKGNKASGSVVVFAYPPAGGSYTVPSGATFTYNGMTYVATSDVVLSWDGNDDNCEQGSSFSAGCRKSATVNIEAAEPGEKYNVSANAPGWESHVGNVKVASGNAVSGGTSNIVTVVTQADVDKAKSSIESSDDESARSEMKESFGDEFMAIDSSFKQTVADPTSSPAVGEEVSDGTTSKLTASTTLTIYAVDKTRIKQYIEAKSNIKDDQKVYSVGEPYFDRFMDGDTGYAAKLKTTIQVGPKITNEEVLEKVKGRKIGEVQSLLKSINGIRNVDIKKSFFWVNSVPDDSNKVTINISVEEQ